MIQAAGDIISGINFLHFQICLQPYLAWHSSGSRIAVNLVRDERESRWTAPNTYNRRKSEWLLCVHNTWKTQKCLIRKGGNTNSHLRDIIAQHDGTFQGALSATLIGTSGNLVFIPVSLPDFSVCHACLCWRKEGFFCCHHFVCILCNKWLTQVHCLIFASKVDSKCYVKLQNYGACSKAYSSVFKKYSHIITFYLKFEVNWCSSYVFS